MAYVTGRTFWPTLQALFPGIPAKSTKVMVIIEPDKPVTVTIEMLADLSGESPVRKQYQLIDIAEEMNGEELVRE